MLDDRNANLGTSRGQQRLAESLKTNGAGRSVLTDRAGRVIAGNKTVMQAKALGLPIQIVPSDGRTLIVVQRDDLDLHADPRARALALADNRIAELDLDWDPEVLAQFRTEGLNIASFWTDQEWAQLVGPTVPVDAAEDHALAPGPTTIKRGDLFTLGQHRLLCGDATDPDDVAQLLGDTVPIVMATDPPYGINYRPERRHASNPHQRTAIGRVLNDTRADWGDAFARYPGDVIYAWHAARIGCVSATALDRAGFEIRSEIIWKKQHFTLGRSEYQWIHEPCHYAVRRGARSRWCGDRSQTTVWEIPTLNPFGGTRSDENTPTGHSTQKPVRLFEIPILNHTKGGDAVYDPFVGSGTTLIAAEKTDRVAYVMDLDPKYVQVALTRWKQFSGKQAKRIGRATTRRRS